MDSRVSGGKGVISSRFGVQIRDVEIDRSARVARDVNGQP